MSTPLSSKQLSFLRAQAHHLDAVVQVGKLGVTETVVRQVGEQLRAHEIIKVRFGQEAPVDAKTAASELALSSDSTLVQTAGRTVTLYRRHDHRPKLELPGMQLRADVATEKKQDPRRSLRRKRTKSEEETGRGPNERAHGPGSRELYSEPRSVRGRLRPRRPGIEHRSL